MSNLGLYQTMTKLAKKVGGPANLFGICLIGGYLIIRPIEAGAKYVIKKIKKNGKDELETIVVYTIKKSGQSNEGKEFNIGDRFVVLEKDKDAVLIQIIGDTTNPYFVSYELLNEISDYK